MIYRIQVLGWEKHNSKKKKGHQYIYVSTRFFDDAKIRMLPTCGKLLYLGLLLRCGDVASNSVECSHDVLVMLSGGRGVVVSRLLDQLQSFQLVTYEKTALIEYNIKEKNIKEKKMKGISREVDKLPTLAPKNSELNKQIWDSYSESYRTRYKVDPTRNATVNGQIAQLAKRLGDEAIDVVKFYVMHNDTFYVSKAHSVGLCLKDAEGLRTQWARGHQITRAGLKRFENQVGQQELLNAIDRGEV
jgi:hypothetical protein